MKKLSHHCPFMLHWSAISFDMKPLVTLILCTLYGKIYRCVSKYGGEPYFHVLRGACSWVCTFWITLFLSWCLMLCFQLFFALWQAFNNFSFLFVLLLFGFYCSHSFATHIILFLLAFSCFSSHSPTLLKVLTLLFDIFWLYFLVLSC